MWWLKEREGEREVNPHFLTLSLSLSLSLSIGVSKGSMFVCVREKEIYIEEEFYKKIDRTYGIRELCSKTSRHD